MQFTTDKLVTDMHEMMGLIFLYKATNGLIDIDSDILPLPRKTTRVTRSSHNNDITTFTSREMQNCNLSTLFLHPHKQDLELSTFFYKTQLPIAEILQI